MLEVVGIMTTLAVGLLISMATVGGIVIGVCAIAGGGCWAWMRRRRSRSER